MITLSQLTNALALQEYGSYRRATEAQHLSQPAFSRSIQNLEASLFPGKTSLDKKSGDLAPSINAEDQTAARIIVAGSNAFSAATPVQIEPWLKSGEFKVLNFKQPWMKVRYGFIYRRDRMLAPAAEAFMQHVREIETEVTQRNQELIRNCIPVSVKT